MKGGLEANLVKTFEEFSQLTAKEMSKAVKRALNKAAAQLQRQTKTNLSTLIKSDTGGHGKYSDKLKDGVLRRGSKGFYDEELTAVVHIMGTQTTGSGTFRLRFLEKGTKPRYAMKYNGQPLMKPRYLGQIKPLWYFKSANEMVEPQLEQIYITEIDKTIQKINTTKQ